MTEVRRKSFQDHLNEVPNPAPDGQTKGILAEFRHYGDAMANEAWRRWDTEQVEEEVRSMGLSAEATTRMLEIALLAANGDIEPQTKRNLGRNYVIPRNSKERGNHE